MTFTAREARGILSHMLAVAIRDLLSELRNALEGIYGPRLQGAYLFGSFARGEADADSDVDVLIVLDRIERYGLEIERTSEAVSRLSLQHGMSISRVFATADAFRRGDRPFLLNAREDAVPL